MIPIIVGVIFVILLCFCIYMLCLTSGLFAQNDFTYDDVLSGSYKAGSILMLGDMSASDKPDEIELQNVSVKLKRDEACYFEGEGVAYIIEDTKTKSGERHVPMSNEVMASFRRVMNNRKKPGVSRQIAYYRGGSQQ